MRPEIAEDLSENIAYCPHMQESPCVRLESGLISKDAKLMAEITEESGSSNSDAENAQNATNSPGQIQAPTHRSGPLMRDVYLPKRLRRRRL